MRKILHIDMDAFFAAVEQRDHPAYRGKPLVVGGNPAKRGVVAAASYEARRYGIHSAMPGRIAVQKCPHLIVVKPRFAVYREISAQIRAIFAEYTDLVEPLALDEAYLDVTVNKLGEPSAIRLAQMIRDRIHTETQLTASAGISINKFLAKVASGRHKPNGQTVILPEQAEAFIAQLPIAQFHGIGPATARRLAQLGIHTGADLRQWTEAALVQQFGKVGRRYYRLARAQDDRPVEPNRIRKSVSAETTFAEDLSDRAQLQAILQTIAQDVQQRLETRQVWGRTVTLKVRYADFHLITRSRTLPAPVQHATDLAAIAIELLATVDVAPKIRLLGIGCSNLCHPQHIPVYEQLELDLAVSY